MDATKFNDVVGKQIVGVVLKESGDGRPPRTQAFVEFADETYFEVYSDSTIRPVQVWPGGRAEVLRYMAERQGVLFQTDAR